MKPNRPSFQEQVCFMMGTRGMRPSFENLAWSLEERAASEHGFVRRYTSRCTHPYPNCPECFPELIRENTIYG